jgi:hypothetical protein
MSLRSGLHMLLMLLMVMPSMVCFPSICAAGKMSISASMPDCHMTMAQKTVKGVVLMKDCLKNDVGESAPVKMPAPDGAIIILGLVALMTLLPLPARNVLPRPAYPPPGLRKNSRSILLATLRLRH